MLRKSYLVLVLLALCIVLPVYAQDCKPPSIVANKGAANMFTPEQEMILGELTVQRLSSEFRSINNARLQKYVDDIGRRIIKHLPETELSYTFHLVDYPEANAFSTPGGHIFLSRKLISFAKSEDELAGVIAHELGHATVHHGAIDMTTLMRAVLKVQSLGDRKDIIEKYNLLIERSNTKNVSQKRGHEGDQQIEADRIALFSMTAAGYDVDAFYTFFDRLTESEGKTGNWFSDIFGRTKPAQKRLREMQSQVGQLPAACRDNRTAVPSEDFLRWQADVVMYREAGRQEELPGLAVKKELNPKLRSDVTHLAFSPDGKQLLVQDEFSIALADIQDRRVLFQVPAEGAEHAAFTADGKQIVFLTSNLRFERWDIASQKPVEVREIVLLNECQTQKMSPDGNYLACVDGSADATIFDIKTGNKVWEKKGIYNFSFYEYMFFAGFYQVMGVRPQFFKIEFSPDSRYAVFSRSQLVRFTVTLDSGLMAGSRDEAIAVDVPARKEVQVRGEIGKVTSHGYLFLDSTRIVGKPSGDPKDSGVFSFPDGKRLQRFTLGGSFITGTQNPNIVVVGPTVETKLGIFDIKSGAMIAGLNKDRVTFWNNLAAFESVGGKVLIREMSGQKGLEGKDLAEIDIPISSIGNLRAAGISNSFGWLSISANSRGGMWNMATGERKSFTRGFRGTVVADDGGAVSFFPKLGDTPNALALVNPHTDEVTAIRDMPNDGAQQYGRFVLLRSPLREKPSPEKDKLVVAGEKVNNARRFQNEGVRLELKDLIKDEMVWSREYPKTFARYSFDALSGRLILYSGVESEEGKARLKEHPELQAKASELGDKLGDSVVEVFDAYAKKSAGAVLVDTGRFSFFVTNGISAGDWLALYDTEGRVLTYSLKDGTLRHRFFGKYAALNPMRNQLAVENFPGEIHIYDLNTGDSTARLVLNGEAIFVRFNLEGNKLFVLSSEQAAYIFDLNKVGVKPATKSS